MRHYSAFSLAKKLLLLGGILAATVIFYPVYRRQQEIKKGRSGMHCQSNLKQILLGLKQYTQDYDEAFPRLSVGHLPVTSPPSNGWVNSLQPYLKSLQIFQCPLEPNSVVGLTDYGYNSPVIGGQNEIKFPNSANTVIMCEIDESEGSLASASGPLVNNRHFEGSNYAFMDGHVKWLHSTRAPLPSSVPTTGSNFTFGR